ncbi:MAG: ABC transporter transmembrane domain-containing protein [Clostridiaceae bacterium]
MGNKFLKDFIKRNAVTYILGIALMLISTYIRLLYPKFMGEAADLLVSNSFTEGEVMRIIFLIILVAVTAFIGAYIWRYLIVGNGRKLERELRTLVFTNFQELSQAFYNKRKTGDLIAYAINDVNAVRLTFGPVLIMSINGMAIILISIFNIFGTVGLKTGAMILSPIPLAVVAMALLGGLIRKRFTLVQKAFGTISDRVNENINGIRVIKAYVQEEAEIEKFSELSKDMYEKNMDMV